MINVNITDNAGAVLKTSGKYCEEDILVIPTTQTKNVKITRNGSTAITLDEGYCGLSEVNVTVDIPLHSVYTNAEGVEF